MKPGIYRGLSFDEYKAIEAVNKSSLDYMEQSPLHFYTHCIDPKRAADAPTEAMQLGTAIHMCLLEPERFRDHYVVEPPGAPRRPTKAQINAKKPAPETIEQIEFWARFDAANKGREVLDREEFETCLDLMRVVKSSDTAQVLLQGGESEVTIVWDDEETGVRCKGRIDRLTPGAILDFKSTQDASKAAFLRQVENMEWDVQSAFYFDGMKALGEECAFIFGALEKKPPRVAKFYAAHDEMLAVGRAIYRKRLKRYALCRKTGEWPGYADEIEDLKPSMWRQKQAAESGEGAA